MEQEALVMSTWEENNGLQPVSFSPYVSRHWPFSKKLVMTFRFVYEAVSKVLEYVIFLVAVSLTHAFYFSNRRQKTRCNIRRNIIIMP